MLKTKMKRVVSLDPNYQSRPINEEARVNLKYQILLQEYLELQKVSNFCTINYILYFLCVFIP